MAGKSRRDQLQELLELVPDDPELHYSLGMEELSAGDPEAAVTRFQRMFVDFPAYVPGYQQAAQALARLGRTREAREALEKGIATARQGGNLHAAEEMTALLATLE